jgi:hypothetical protein
MARRDIYLQDIPLEEALNRFWTALEGADLLQPLPGEEVEIEQALGRVLDSGFFILGPEGEGFERELAAALGAAGYDQAASGPAAPYRAVGCPACGRTGYRGRIALHEVMHVSEEIERLAVERRSSDEINRVAVEQGMVQLRGDGIAEVFAGITSIEEIQRVVV